MEFDKKSLKNLERLCRIKCSEEEAPDLLQNLQKILSYVEQLNEVNTDNVSECYHILEDVPTTSSREDVVGTHLSRDVFLANAPEHIGGMIKVPTVIQFEE
ncbi:MAG: Asp-tRNA(Asn)/Glu-tRNA(Gln) amidotransferase subunit GatC [Parachlamydiales bacterium]|nr:Asp-tRNA(Asn)/Glu-tRNA(Gln) amidotransferase subunit GatC [Parachlamydiales bacterium]